MSDDDLPEADRALFRRSIGRVRVLHDDKVRAPKRRAKRASAAVTEPRRIREDDLPDGVLDDAPGAGDRQSFRRTGVQLREFRRLERGTPPIEAGLDLHGMNVREAREALALFLEECRDRGVRRARIVHGKGFGSARAQPVLKGQVDRWLRLRSEVLAFCSAPLADGGTGAVYVLLKRTAQR